MGRVPPSPRSHPWPQRSQAPRWCSVAAACVQEKLAVGAAADAEVGCRYLRPASRDESGSEPLPDPEVRPCWYLGRSRCRKCGVAGTSGPLPRRSSWDEHSASMSTFWRLLIMASLTWAMSGCPPARRPSKFGGGYRQSRTKRRISCPPRCGSAKRWPSVLPRCGPAKRRVSVCCPAALPRCGPAIQCCPTAAPSVAPPRPGEAVHLSIVPLRPAEAPHLSVAPLRRPVWPSCGLAKRCISA